MIPQLSLQYYKITFLKAMQHEMQHEDDTISRKYSPGHPVKARAIDFPAVGTGEAFYLMYFDVLILFQALL